ncbi:hypothetical protein F4808DRAFT_475177 [Astrocystis sublimbata]|nr:hypothetical protein F4808DRAFT_475177 [Astrocystis sublimbata]
MKFSILSSILLFSWQSATVLAAPVVGPTTTDTVVQLEARANNIPNADQVQGLIDDPSKFSGWANIGEPQINKAVFFTGQKRQVIGMIRDWANGQGLTTVRDIWKDANFFQRGQYKGISDDTFKEFQKAFSKYYASQTKGTAWLVFPHDQTPSSGGIFWSVELDEIISQAKVDKIVWIDQNQITDSNYDWMNEGKVYWTKGSDKPAGA